MTKTELRDKRIGFYFHNEDDVQTIINTTEEIFSKNGDTKITNTNLRTNLNSENAPDYIDYNCKLEIDFDIICEDEIIIGQRVANQVEESLSLEDFDLYYTDA